MIVATAGHVDHGKTTLVRALTGIDTDRLPDERRRGLSIDLGFAHADLGGDVPAGFVDVPGHARFLRNMLAGVAAVDAVLLVVAADDGPMPQTHEHLAILRLLGVPRIVVALTRCDRADAARQAAATADVQAALAAHGHAPAPVFALATPSGDGVDALRRHLAELQRTLPARPANGHFRLAVDRAFSVAGAGLVVTGAVFAGEARVGDTLVLGPAGVALRVRGIHAQHRPADAARAGQRCAINVAGADAKRAAARRGDWLVAPALHAPTLRVDVRLQALPGARPLVDGMELQVHHGAAAVAARLALLDGRRLPAGGDGWAQLVLRAPLLACVGDPLVLRDPAAQATVAGARVVDPFGPDHGRARPARLAQLAAMAAATPAEALRARLAAEPLGVPLARFEQAWNLRPDEAAALQATLPLRRTASGLALDTGRWQRLRERAVDAVARRHADEPAAVGPDDAELHRLLDLPPAAHWLRELLAELAAQGALVHDGLRWRLPSHRPRLDDTDGALLQQVVPHLETGGLRPPIVGELAVRVGQPLPALRDGLERVARLGHLVRVAPNRYFLPSTVHALGRIAAELAEASPDGFDAAAYRDRSGIGRNLTVEVLEYLDRTGVTVFRRGRRRLAGQREPAASGPAATGGVLA